jgi:hypothetical protein
MSELPELLIERKLLKKFKNNLETVEYIKIKISAMVAGDYCR